MAPPRCFIKRWLCCLFVINSFYDHVACEEAPLEPTTGGVNVQVFESLERRVISIADLHGDLAKALTLLADLGFINSSTGAWTGGHNVLVQTGDVLDRGPEGLALYDHFFRLQDEAVAAGGEVILLMGNHEILNMCGDHRYASDEEQRRLGNVSRSALLKRELMARTQAVARLGSSYGFEKAPIVFAHAGLEPDVVEMFSKSGRDRIVDAINTAFKQHLSSGSFCQHGESSHVLFGRRGPLWSRRHALSLDPGSICPELQRSLSLLSATRLIVGHSRQVEGKVRSRCGGQLLLADTGISAALEGGGHASAIEHFRDGAAQALYDRMHVADWLPNVSAPLSPHKASAVDATADALRWRLETLGFERGSVPQTVSGLRKAFRRQLRNTHPDRGSPQAAFDELTTAFERAMQDLGFV
eukprot:TRINITY_DN57995_c0_g1_i1.p1 TRINITY_DN57995_c0_g1~~TRINITY_DN57995_c0_g1_i1.p1  ORF type:complete len:414 (-),score=60.59 TRINITY_DN57995_c0_g1_i1:196-1437(-)